MTLVNTLIILELVITIKWKVYILINGSYVFKYASMLCITHVDYISAWEPVGRTYTVVTYVNNQREHASGSVSRNPTSMNFT